MQTNDFWGEKAFVADGTLDSLHTAFSRVDRKIYVQDLMLEQGEKLAEMVSFFRPSFASSFFLAYYFPFQILKKRAHVFVCGDGINMAKGVQAAVAKLLERFGDMKDKQSTAAYIQNMVKERRYVQDVWC